MISFLVQKITINECSIHRIHLLIYHKNDDNRFHYIIAVDVNVEISIQIYVKLKIIRNQK